MPQSKYTIFDQMIEGVQIIAKDWKYIYVNDTVTLQGKYRKEELLGYTMMEKYPGIEKTEMFGFIKKCMEEGSRHQMINEFDFPDASKGYFELRIQPVPEGVLIFSFDVTKQKEAEMFLQNHNVLLEEMVRQRTAELMVKNEELEQFTYIASHDLQEPLRTVSNYIEVLKEDFGSEVDATAIEYLDAIRRATRRMNELIRGLLDFSRLGLKRKLSRVDFQQLLNEVIADLKDTIQNSGAIIEIGEMPILDVYKSEMRQLFQNFITNAIKFRKEGIKPEVHIRAERLTGKWQFSVNDNGIGIDPKYFDRIFLIFQRLHKLSKYAGHGLGLANSKKIVEIHGGNIWVESEPGKGSTFFFTISELYD